MRGCQTQLNPSLCDPEVTPLPLAVPRSMRVYSVSYINKNTQITDVYFLALVSHPLCLLVHGAGLIIPVIWGSVLVLVRIAPWAA